MLRTAHQWRSSNLNQTVQHVQLVCTADMDQCPTSVDSAMLILDLPHDCSMLMNDVQPAAMA